MSRSVQCGTELDWERYCSDVEDYDEHCPNCGRVGPADGVGCDCVDWALDLAIEQLETTRRRWVDEAIELRNGNTEVRRSMARVYERAVADTGPALEKLRQERARRRRA